MILKKIKLVAGIILLISANAYGALTWTPGEGWSADGGLLEPIIGKRLSVKDAADTMCVAEQEYCKGNEIQALNLYARVYKKYPESAEAPEALYQEGLIYLNRKQYNNAFKSFQKIIVNYPGYPRFNDVIHLQFEIASKLQRGKRPYYWGIIPGFKDYNASIEYFESIVTNAPYSPYAPMALMNIADLSKAKRKPEEVIDALDRLVTNYRYSELAPSAYIMLAETYEKLVQGPEYDQGSTIKAINYYQDFLFLYPENELVGRAEKGLKRAQEKLSRSKLTMGDFYYKYRNNNTAAKIYYNEAISVAPKTKTAAIARKQLDKIADGVKPPKTIADWIFGRYKPLSTPAYLDEVELSKRENEEFTYEYTDVYVGNALEDIESGEIVEDYPRESLEDKREEEELDTIEKWSGGGSAQQCCQ